MAYDATKPLDDGYLAEAPAELRELHRALKEDKIVNAGMLNGYTQGNGSGKIPLNNGTLNVNLNADMLDGHDSAYFSADGHVHSGATTSANGFMTTTQVTKLNGIATGAEVNQYAFSNVKVSSSTVQADAKQDTLELAAGNAITLTANTTDDKVTIAVTSNTYLPLTGGTVTGTINFNLNSPYYAIKNNTNNNYLAFLGGSTGGADAGAKLILYGADHENVGQFVLQAGNANGYKQLIGKQDGTLTWGGNNVIYSHPTTAGNKHIPSGGSSGQILRWSAAGTAARGDDNDT